MSSKPRARRNRGEKKQFVEKEEENEVGVMDEDTKNKIEEKQEDMFDPKQLQQNVLQQTSQANHNAFIDFEDDPTLGDSELRDPDLDKKKEDASGRKQRKQRGKREVKKFDSDQQPNQQRQPEEQTHAQKPTLDANQREELQDEQIEMPQPQGTKEEEAREAQKKEEQLAKAETAKMKELVGKKTQQDNYVLMHALINKAGTNKEERKRVIFTPLEPGQHSFVFFKRFQSGFSEYYQVVGEDQRPVFFCENQRGCIGCNYYISLTKEMDKNNPAYLGKLRGNAAGSIYQLYDHGLQPNHNYDRSKFRVSMAYIEYESNFLGMKGPRKLKAVVPAVQAYEDFDMFKFSEEESLNDFHGTNVIRLRNKQPRWNERLKSYALNFGGRVKQASIKNFILIEDKFSLEEEEKAPNAIVFGKVEESTFALEFGHPLSLFQAFGIAMSEFDFKLKCE